MAEKRDIPRPAEDMHARIMGEKPFGDTNRNRTQPSAPDQAPEGELAAGRGEPGAGGLPNDEAVRRRAEQDNAKPRYDDSTRRPSDRR